MTLREWLCEPILKEIQKIMATQQDLDTVLTALGDEVTKLSTSLADVVTQVTNLITKIQNGSTGPDLTNEVTALQSMLSTLQTQQSNVDAAVTAAKGVTGQ